MKQFIQLDAYMMMEKIENSLKTSSYRTCIFLGFLVSMSSCGGGGSGGSTSSPTAANTSLKISVMDGLIQGATVCLDQNINGVCDASEPQAVTDSNGQASISVAAADVGKYPVVAVVPASAIDKDTNTAVGTAYVMKAPKDAASLITPLTTLVQNTVDATGGTTQSAASAVQSLIGTSNSPLADYTKTGEAKAQSIANALVIATQSQNKQIAGTVGSLTSTGAAVTQADVDNVTSQSVSGLLSQIVTVAGSSAVSTATSVEGRLNEIKRQVDPIVTASGVKNKAAAVALVEQYSQANESSTKRYCTAGFMLIVGTGKDRGCVATWTSTRDILTADQCIAIGTKYGYTFTNVFTNVNGSYCVYDFRYLK